jgi:hypothetical protein
MQLRIILSPFTVPEQASTQKRGLPSRAPPLNQIGNKKNIFYKKSDIELFT